MEGSTQIDRWLRTLSTAMVLCALIIVVPLIMGSALANPPVQCRAFEFSAATTLVPNGSDVTVTFSSLNLGATASIVIINDNTAGGNDIICSLSAFTAAAPTSTAASTSFRVKAASSIILDGRWDHVTMRGDGGTGAARLVASF